MTPTTPEPVGNFQPYLDAVIKSGERTRSVTYVTLLVLFFTACAIRNEVYPAWDATRLKRMQEYYHCAANLRPPSADCRTLELYEGQGIMPRLPSGGMSPDDQEALKKFRRDLYQARITELMKSRLSGYKLHIPLFGVFIDINDLWLVSGVLTAGLLLILTAHMERQLANFRKAQAVCPNNACRDLMIMGQIFALPGEVRPLRRRARRILLDAIYWLPAVLYLIVIADDMLSFTDGILFLLATGGTWVEYAVRVLVFVGVVYLCYRCRSASNQLDDLVLQTSQTNFSPR